MVIRVVDTNKYMLMATSSAYKQTIFLTHDIWMEVENTSMMRARAIIQLQLGK